MLRDEMIGKKFGRLTVVSDAEPGRHKYSVTCVCDCGVSRVVNVSSLRSGHTKSCGCLRLDRVRKHMKSHSPEWRLWSHMIERCESPNHHNYARYGGRGIAVCKRWRQSLDAFLHDVGPRPSPKHTLDRINVHGDYEPGNVRWATATEQANNRCNTIIVSFNGKTKPLKEWAIEYGLPYALVVDRYRRQGWSIEDALTRTTRKYSRAIPCIAPTVREGVK